MPRSPNAASYAKLFVGWRGPSGQTRIHSVYAPADVPRYAHAVYLVVRRENARRRVLASAATGPFADLWLFGARYRAALRNGGNEVHVHVPADAAALRAALRDLEEGMPEPAGMFTLAGGRCLRPEPLEGLSAP